jgi:hypothetical protein
LANDTGGLFQTLVAASSDAAEALKFQNALVDAIFWDYKPDPQQPFTGLTVNVPSVDESDVADIGSGPLLPSDTKHSTITVPFNQHFSTSFVIKTWDQARTPTQLKDKYMKPKMEGLLRRVNRTIAGLVNTTNFSTYSLITGATTGEIVRADIKTAWANLANAGAPVEDDGNMFLIESVNSYGAQVADSNFINQYIVGDRAAIEAQQRAKLVTQYGCEVRYDQHFPTGMLGSSKEPGLFMHRYAIAAVTSPPHPSDDPSVKEFTFKLKGQLPVQVQVQYSLKDQGYLVNIHCWWGLKVARPELGSLLQSA